MSHDRGCACGRERSEYSSCVEPNCLKREAKMRDTDWRPSPCPECGEMREAARHPVCRNVDCVNDVAKRHLKTITKQEPERYVLLRSNGYATIIDDPVTAWNDSTFNKLEDRIYRLGEEVEVKVSVSVKNKKPVYRGNEL